MENREFYINHDGIRLHAKLDFPKQEAEKYPLVIIEHGYTGHMEERHIRAVAQAVNDNGFASLRIELYGHGQSDGEFRNHTIMKWVDEMLTVVDYAAGLDFVDGLYLAGHSQGGLTTMLVGALKRDVLKAILPLAPAIVIWDAARAGNLFGTQMDPDHIPNEIMMPGDRLLGNNYFRVAQMLPVEEAIDKYTGPVLIVHADTDEAVPVSYAIDAAKRYKNAELVIIEGDTHCYDNKLPEVTEAVVRFLKRVEGSN